MKKLIAYYSRAGENYFGGAYRRVAVGNTEKAARMLAELTGGNSLSSNIQLVYNNAALAARTAVIYSKL